MADFTFRRYELNDNGIHMDFVNFAPGPGLPTDYRIFFTFAELDAITTQVALRNAVVARLRRKVEALGYATKLDPFIGQVVTI